ncbi:MAG: enoyl-CoA hydratase/isomerase family protein [Mesorhizobium sp.]|nr:enoyl-CoA hydratase/isomerase family protein [Mesorhizobium sp.]
MSTVTVEQADDVATIKLNRPEKLNALSDEMVDAFFAALDAIAGSDARALVITGAGRGFCAGFDLSLAGDGSGDPAFWARRQERFGSLVTRIRNIPQPTIAAVNGAATGAGLGLALACDTRIGSAAARFSSAFIRVGMSSCDVGVSWLLPRAIGTTRAFEMMLTGRMVEAEEAERIGLIMRLAAPEKLLEDAQGLAQAIAQNGQIGTWMTKRGMWANLEAGSLQAAIELENRTQAFMLGTGGLAARASERGFLKKD